MALLMTGYVAVAVWYLAFTPVKPPTETASSPSRLPLVQATSMLAVPQVPHPEASNELDGIYRLVPRFEPPPLPLPQWGPRDRQVLLPEVFQPEPVRLLDRSVMPLEPSRSSLDLIDPRPAIELNLWPL